MDVPSLPPSNRTELQLLLKKAKAAVERGDQVDSERLLAVQKQYYVDILMKLCEGKGDNLDVKDLVCWHWPQFVEKQPEMPIDDWQCSIIRNILAGRKTDLKEVFIKGCTKAGKGFAVGVAVCLWYQSCKASCRVIVTSNSADHAKKVMMAEILRLRKLMRYACPGRNTREQVWTSDTKYIKVANPEFEESMSGQHSEATLFVFDESSGVAEIFFDLAETQAAMIACLSNPRQAKGWFKRAYPTANPDKNQVINIAGGRRALHTIGGLDCINVKLGRILIPAQIDRARYDAIKAKGEKWGRVFGDGKFPKDGDETIVISPAWLERHVNAWSKSIDVVAFSLDVAASIAGDLSIFSAGGPGGIRKQHIIQTADTMTVVGWVLNLAFEGYGINLKDGDHPLTCDMDGLGKGVGDRLAEQGVNVLEYRGNDRSYDPKKYRNVRAEGYGELGDRLNPIGPYPDDPFGLPNDHLLHEDLCAHEKIFSSDGFSYKLTPKSVSRKGEDTILRLLGRSPDRGDGAVMLYHAVRWWNKVTTWGESWKGELLCSGENPREESKPLKDEEIAELPDWLADIVESARDRSYLEDLEEDLPRQPDIDIFP